MVPLPEVQASNSLIASALPTGLVAVFVGGTNGVGETTLRQFAKHATKPRIYCIGRSQEAWDRIAAECKELNPEGEYSFMKADTSLIRSVDDICKDIKAKEKTINLLFLSTGTLNFTSETPEGLNLAMSLAYYSRTRFISNLLPLIQNATALRRVVTCFAATKEGPVDTSDFPGRNISLMSARGHGASVVTMSLEALAKQAPGVSFVHDFPGPVKSGIGRGSTGIVIAIMKLIFTIIGPFINMDIQESGERHLFFGTSARYPAATGTDTAGVRDGVAVAKGTIGETGSGVYSIDQYGESAGPKVEELLAKMREEGTVEKLWKHTEEEYTRVTESGTA